MIERLIYGPIEILPPTAVGKAILEIEGIKEADKPYTTYVFLGEVHGNDIEELIKSYNYAGSFSIVGSSSETLQLDITKALNIALDVMPNFNITFLTRCEWAEDREGCEPLFGFRRLHINHVHDMHPDAEHLAGVEGH
ncbi:MAG: hypothetical protein V3V05_06985 [Pontiella sp.]